MHKFPLIFIIFALSGCIDFDQIKTHSKLTTAYINGTQQEVTNCLYSTALKQHLSLIRDEPYSDGSERYNLQDDNYKNVAWVDLSKFGKKQTSVYFYHIPEVTDAISYMVSKCNKSLY